MIKANELRIGNLIAMPTDSGKPYWKVLEIRENGVIYGIDWESGAAFCKLDVPDPVPLTPEWLGRCGFKRTGSLGDVFIKEGVALCMNAAGFMFEWPADHWDEDNEGNVRIIETVHQLQNLYFTLTGEELNVKL